MIALLENSIYQLQDVKFLNRNPIGGTFTENYIENSNVFHLLIAKVRRCALWILKQRPQLRERAFKLS